MFEGLNDDYDDVYSPAAVCLKIIEKFFKVCDDINNVKKS